MSPVDAKANESSGGPGSGRRERDALGLARYVPSYLARRIASRQTESIASLEERSWGATLFVDLAGFTKVTERFALVAAGAEQLSDILNDHFGRMTAIIGAFGGDVVLYAGDATLAVWPAQSAEALPEATMLAAQCAWEIRLQLPRLEVDSQVALRQRAVVGAGELSLYEIGGLDRRWLSLLAGPSLAGLAQALREVPAGEVALTPATWSLIRDRCRATRTAGNTMRLVELTASVREASSEPAVPIDVPDDLLAAYVPEVLAERLTAGHGDWIAEFRHVSVIFAGLGGLADSGGQLERLQLVAVSFQQALKQQGGMVYQVARDDKGAVLIGVFGLPTLAQENGAVRAVEAPAAAPVRRRGAPGPRRPPLAAPPRRTLALGRPDHHRGHPPAGHPFRMPGHTIRRWPGRVKHDATE